MEKILIRYIFEECQKHIERHYDYLFYLEENIKRKKRRLGIPVSKNILRPHYWSIHHGFNPFKVRNKNRLNTYAYTISGKLKSLTYSPCTSIIHPIPKPSGGKRELNIFQIPDAAISLFAYKSLLEKNVNRLSAYAYAYREDRNAHDAILNIASDWNMRDRVYVAEFDFSKFFDQIRHDYLYNTLRTRGFLFTEMEEHIIDAFLKSRFASASSYEAIDGGTKRDRGIPQGTSISLFLANLACWELDQELESMGVQFARYADDTLVWSNSYDQVVKAYDAIYYFSKLMGVPINFEKSEGITLISEKSRGELKTKSSVMFLGYDISLKQVSISKKGVAHIKKRISYLIYENLIQPLKRGIFNSAQLNKLDWDYVTALAQIRRYLYGGLNDIKLRHYKMGIIRNLKFRGVMSYYPLVNNEDQLKSLDGWLIHTLKQSLRLREEIWLKEKGIKLPGPTTNWIDQIVDIKTWKSSSNSKSYDLRIPSFLLISQAMRVGLRQGGITSVTNPKSRYYSAQTGSKQKP